MKIGIVGMGIVGSANAAGFTLLGHQVKSHDIKFDTTLNNVLDTEIIFLCVPTPTDDSNKCNTSIVEEVIFELNKKEYSGIIAIRSTVTPGFTEKVIEKYPNLIICFVPEFLRERCAADDFINNHQLLAVGTNDVYVYQKIISAHGHLPKNSKQLTPTEAEILKYFNNVYAALRITFANIMYEVCEKFSCDYSLVKNSYILTGKSNDLYLDVNNNLRGYGGMCLPKDVKALISILNDHNLNFNLINSIDQDNEKVKTTVFNGMRK